jgi:HSP20 family protein
VNPLKLGLWGFGTQFANYIGIMKYSTKSFFEQPSLFSVFNDSIGSIIDSSMDSYKYRTVVDEQDGAYIVTAQVPGLSKDDISIKIEDNVLTIDGEKTITEKMESSIHRELPIGDNIDVSKAHAEINNGILTLTLPKNTKKKAKSIRIK